MYIKCHLHIRKIFNQILRDIFTQWKKRGGGGSSLMALLLFTTFLSTLIVGIQNILDMEALIS